MAQDGTPVAATVLGTIGTGPYVRARFWCVQLVPQIWTNWRTKSTEGLPALMMFLWAICGVPFGAYNIIVDFNIPLQIQPQMFMSLCLCSFAQILVYHHKVPVWKGAVIGFSLAAAFAGVETALILTLRPKYNRGEHAPAIVVGIFASVLLAMGLLPPYFEIYKRHGRVIGINWVFLSMDWLGAFFSLMALTAQNSFDVLGGVIYIICALLEIGIFSFHIIWRLRTRSLRKQAKEEGKSFDELGAEKLENGEEWHWTERRLPSALSFTWWCQLIKGRKVSPEDDEEAATSQLDCEGQRDDQRDERCREDGADTTFQGDEKYGGENPSSSVGEIAPAAHHGHSTTRADAIPEASEAVSHGEKER